MTTKTIPAGAMTNALPIIDPRDMPGEPELVPDGMFQNPNILDAVTILKNRYKDDPTVFVDGGTIICYNPANLNDRVFPDCYVAFDVPAGAIFAQNGYLTWQVGKPPDFALEIASKSTARHDITDKRDLYERIGVKEYWRFDPSGGDYYGTSLAADRLLDGAYEPIEKVINADGMVSAHSALLGLILCVQEGMHPIAHEVRMNRLLLYDPDAGEYLQNIEEMQAGLTETQAELTETQAGLTETQAGLTETRAELTETQAELTETRAGLTETQARTHEVKAELRRLQSD